ncbi:MAG: hypothetical protein PVI88_06365 [Nitrosopumilaceae archaeon]|jgi:hypothetical protein
MDEIKNRENLRKEMIDAQKQQKILLEKRDLSLSSKPPNKIDALQTTHKIAKLQDFIKFAENTLKMSD